jgi:hypothetical protein
MKNYLKGKGVFHVMSVKPFPAEVGNGHPDFWAQDLVDSCLHRNNDLRWRKLPDSPIE